MIDSAADLAQRRLVRRGQGQPNGGACRGGARGLPEPAGTMASSPSAAGPRSIPARSSRSCRGRRGRCGISRTSGTGGRGPIRPGIAPVVAVPTTAGTGSEVGRAGVILNEETHQKKIIFHPQMMPHVVILDPELTVGLPRAVTAATGMDAFVHCFEAFCAPGFHPLADGVALEGMRLIQRSICRAPAPTDTTSRRAPRCSPPLRWARQHSRKASAACMLSRIRWDPGSTRITD